MFQKVRSWLSKSGRIQRKFFPEARREDYSRIRPQYSGKQVSHPLARLLFSILNQDPYYIMVERTGLSHEEIQKLLFKCAPEFGDSIFLHLSGGIKRLREVYRIANSPEDIPLTSMHLELTSQILNFIRSYEKPKPSAEELKANQEWQDFRYRHRSRRRNKR